MGANSFSLLAAASGFLASYFNSKFIEERKARIERVNEQLREFVGPLLATVATSHSAWAAMIAQTGMSARAFQEAVAADPRGSEAAAYRAWMTSVLQPLNEKGEEEVSPLPVSPSSPPPANNKNQPNQTPNNNTTAAALVFERIDLLDDVAAVPELMQLVAHTCTTRVVLQRWTEGDLSARSRVSYPDTLLAWSQRTFLKAKKQQASLLGTAGGPGEAVKKVVTGGAGDGRHHGGGSGGAADDEAALLSVPTRPRHLRSRL
jgi:hypothetical protein